MKKFALLACAFLVLATSAQAATHHHRHHRHHPPHHVTQPAPPVLVPHVLSFTGNTAAICDQGFCSPSAPTTAVSVAQCPAGYTVVAGGWETFGDAPHNATVTENHPVSTEWVVVMEVPAPTDHSIPQYLAHFRAIAQCQILLPA